MERDFKPPFAGRDRCQRLYRDVGDDSPWYEKALFYALSSLEMDEHPSRALAKIEQALAERPSEISPLETTQDLRTHVGSGIYVKPLGHMPPASPSKEDNDA